MTRGSLVLFKLETCRNICGISIKVSHMKKIKEIQYNLKEMNEFLKPNFLPEEIL